MNVERGYRHAEEEPMRNRPKIVQRVEHVIDEHTGPDSSPPARSEGEVKAAQQEEMRASFSGPGMPTMTEGMWKGFVLGSLAGGAIGAAVFALFGFLPIGDIDTGWRVLLFAAIGALAGGTAGALYFGGRLPELTGETTDSEGRAGVGTTPRDPTTDERGR
jgi:hypothetical protein